MLRRADRAGVEIGAERMTERRSLVSRWTRDRNGDRESQGDAEPENLPGGRGYVLADRVCSGLLLLIGCATLYRSWQLQHGSWRVGPGTFPMVLAVLLVVLSSLLLFRPAATDAVALDGGRIGRGVVGLFASVVVYVGLLSKIGFIPSAIAFGIIFLVGVCRESWWKSTLYVVVLTLVCYELFDSVLGAPLPSWGG